MAPSRAWLQWGCQSFLLESGTSQLRNPAAEVRSSASLKPATCSTEPAVLSAGQLQLVTPCQLRSTTQVSSIEEVAPPTCNAAAKRWRLHRHLCKRTADACCRLEPVTCNQLRPDSCSCCGRDTSCGCAAGTCHPHPGHPKPASSVWDVSCSQPDRQRIMIASMLTGARRRASQPQAAMQHLNTHGIL